ncbi:MFS transporter [Clostridium saccharobutylicum]|uniref:Inner membrane transport protein YdiM n=1 Tax=Clostridium saccharobutylicum DSM 13864 TaxID=1345695 RepID=U5MM87_CLOSA|nr:MFS transporter [Clostridium saccharobutylicum]AGX41715.1 inner membrane transport protein YdiM [Clostridium saccharobutylicum DSM 13864]AQR88995.1 inner membrane transport protein YdiM [Clostridium saccharobutylicum]AQR98896.1 inner membrane transport protein YdiM [Clostridium saccharobutylicum]AQS08615.1 inner membrane transport protein YdiM [Clostridium saccharobutylicum]AQS12884.1 inner membrane transport protein YdiM [Clostridium saccharobutylicum]
MKNKYMPTAISMYINYFVHGMGAIILAQNITFLMQQLNTDKAGVSYVISALGLGRLIVLFASGALSDKLGRKPFVLLGMGTYILFFGGILMSPNVTVAFIFALIAGMANSFLDSGTYPALMECFPEATGSANIMIKAFMSAGQFALPMIISILVNNNLYFGYSFILCLAILLINGLVLFKLQFPAFKAVEKEEAAVEIEVNHKANLLIEGICLILIGFTATATFYIISVWLPTYGQEVANMPKTSSLQLISYYSAGSIASVFITSILVKKWIKQVRFVIIYPLFSLVTLTVLYFNPTPMICILSAFLIGFTAAGGVLQLALTTMSELFPTSKGKITGIVYTSSSIASFVMPAITGVISKTSVSGIILLDMGIAAVGVVLALVVNIRYNVVMKKAA